MTLSLEPFEAIVSSIHTAPEFSDLEILKWTIRRERGVVMIGVVIDRESGVDTNVCEAVSKHIARRADALPPPVPLYQVEVASAGLERPLLTPEHFRRFAGRAAKVVTTLRIRNRTEFSGPIEAADETAVTIADPHAGPTPIPYAAVKRASLVYDPRADLRKRG